MSILSISKYEPCHEALVLTLQTCILSYEQNDVLFNFIHNHPQVLDRFIPLLHFHGLSPHFYEILQKQKAQSEIIPRKAMLSLKNAYYSNVKRSILINETLHRINKLLTGEKIEFMILKGALLSNCFYSNPALRPMDDIDLLILHPQIEQAESALKKAGFLVDETFRSQEHFRNNVHHIVPYVDPFTSIPVELHHQAHEKHSGVYIPSEDIWSRSRLIILNDFTVRIPCPEDHIIILVLHIITHVRFKLLFFNDLLLSFNSSTSLPLTFTWNELASLIIKYKIHDLIYPVLTVLNSIIPQNRHYHLLEYKFPFDIEQITRLFPNLRSGKWLAPNNHFISNAFTQTFAMDRVDTLKFVFSSSFLSKCIFLVKYILRHVFPRAEFMRKRYDLNSNTGLTALIFYYFLRPFALIFFHRAMILRALKRIPALLKN